MTEILAGNAAIEKGKDYVFNIHSIAGVFGSKSLKEVEGQAFLWYLVIRTGKAEPPVANLYRGEPLWDDFKKQKKEDKSAPAKSS